MTDHYFNPNPESEHKINSFTYKYLDKIYTFKTDNGVFSKSQIDKGTEILISSLPRLYGKVIDMGCGYGVISIILSSLYKDIDILGIDINKRATDLAYDNAISNNSSAKFICSDGALNLDLHEYDYAIINPPIRAGKAVIYRLFTELSDLLKNDGELYIVIRTKHGAKSAIEFLKTLFNIVKTINIKSGYRIIKCREKVK